MKITDALLAEHALFYPLFDSVERILEGAASSDVLKAAFEVLESAVLTHAGVEEELLFPALASSRVAAGPLAVLRAEHQDIDRQVVAFSLAPSLDQAKDALRRLLADLRDHYRNEEQLVFPMCEATLGEDKLRELGEEWAKKRAV